MTVGTGSQTFTANGFVGIKVAGVGANDGTQGANAAFSSGDLQGTITRIDETTFNAMSPAQLRAAYDALIITWASDAGLDVDWGTRLEPYLQLGGGVIFEDYNNVGDLAPLITATTTSGGGDGGFFSVTSTVSGLTDGINGSFDNNHIEFNAWDGSLLASFLDFTTDDEVTSIVGLYGKIGTGCIVLTGPDQDYHGFRGSPDPAGNQYNLLLNELRFVTGGAGDCTIPEVPVGSASSLRSAIKAYGSPRPSLAKRHGAFTPQVPQQKRVAKRPIQ